MILLPKLVRSCFNLYKPKATIIHVRFQCTNDTSLAPVKNRIHKAAFECEQSHVTSRADPDLAGGARSSLTSTPRYAPNAPQAPVAHARPTFIRGRSSSAALIIQTITVCLYNGAACAESKIERRMLLSLSLHVTTKRALITTGEGSTRAQQEERARTHTAQDGRL